MDSRLRGNDEVIVADVGDLSTYFSNPNIRAALR
jgi:hypothetical protein